MLLSELKKELNLTYEQLGKLCSPAAGYNSTKSRCDRGWIAKKLENGEYVVSPPSTLIILKVKL